MKLFKRCQINLEVAYLAATALITWSLLFLFMTHSSSSKYSHLIRDYDIYRERIKQSELSSIQALDQLKAWKKHSHPNSSLFDRIHSSSQGPYMCVAVMSKRRIGSNVNFAAQSIAALLTRTPFRFEDKVNMIVFNTEDKPAENEFLTRDINGLVKLVNISAQINHSYLRINEAMDYVLILRHLNSLNCNYSLIMEDDAIIAYKWFSLLETEIESTLSRRGDWAFVKLFYGYKFFDWDWIWSLSVIIKVLMLGLFLYLVQFTFIINIFSKKFSSISLFIIFGNSVALVVFFNATCINPMGAGVHKYTTGFSAVSVLIPNKRLTVIADFIEDHVDDYLNSRIGEFIPKDLLLTSYSKASRSVEFVFEPSLVQHIGIYSSIYLRDVSEYGYQQMFKSFSFASHFEPIRFNLNYSLSLKKTKF